MTQGVVAGYDGSPGSDQALRWAVREAGARETALTVCLAWAPDHLALLGAPDIYELAEQRGEEILGTPDIYELAEQRGEEILGRGLRYAESVLGPDRVHPALIRESAARALCERSRTAEMVVVGSRGHGGLADLRLGSVSWQLAGHGNGRIVIVRGRWRPVNQAPGPVVVGVDGSPASLAAITFAFEEAALRDVALVAVCALADAPGILGGARQKEEDFSHLMAHQEKEYPEVTVLRQVAVGSPRPALLNAAAQAQMLVVGARGLGGLHGMSLGSVALAVLGHSPCPVGIVHPPAPGARW